MTHQIRILVAKPGLDGHDKGAKVLVNILRDAGMEVIYTGLHQTAQMVTRAAVQEDVDIVGLSYLSGAHVGLTKEIIEALNEADATHMKVIVGGNIPKRDYETLEEMGVSAIFAGGSPYEEIISSINNLMN